MTGTYAIEIEDVGVPNEQGETWAEVAERLRREVGSYPHPHAVGCVGVGDEIPTRGPLIGPLPELDGADQAAVFSAVWALEDGDRQ